MKPEDLTPRQLSALADAHVRRFKNLIESARSGMRGVRVGECEHYVEVWTAVQRAAISAMVRRVDRADLPDDGRDEVQDAIDCGDYDELLEAAARPPS